MKKNISTGACDIFSHAFTKQTVLTQTETYSKKILRVVLILIALVWTREISAQTHSPFYTEPCEAIPQKTSTVIVGNILCYNNKREFPQKKDESDVTDAIRQSTDLGIGGTYKDDYYTMVVHVTEPGTYKLIFDAAHNSDTRYLWVYQSQTSFTDIPSVDATDSGIEYVEIGKQQLPITGSWTKYEPIEFTADLKEGYNYVKFVFDDRYGGNIGGIRIVHYVPTFTELTLGGNDILQMFEESDSYTVSLPEGTTELPQVETVVNDLATVEVKQATMENMTATIRLYEKSSNTLLRTLTINYQFVSTISGSSFKWTTEDGATQPLNDGSKYKYVRTSTLNSSFQIKSANNIYNDSRFKIKAGQEYALCIPVNAVVERVTFVDCCENYYNRPEGSNLDSEWDYISSGNASVEISDTHIGESTNITATFTGHQTGQPILFCVKKCSEIAYSAIIIEYAQSNDHCLNYLGINAADGEEKNISGSFTLTFDRNISIADANSITVDGETVRAIATGNTLTAYYWELPYATNHTLKVATGTVVDIFNNKYDEDIIINFKTKAEEALQMSTYDYVVGTIDEFYDAIAAINASNTTADAPLRRIFIKNGTYTMNEETAVISAHNVSIIGQSMKETILQGTNTTDGHGSAMLKIDGTNIYLQDITIRTADWRTEQFLANATSYGRILAIFATNQKMIMKRVALQSNQDTYLCGHRAYHEDCAIHGTVDFIYSGGDNYFKDCTIVLENRRGDVITAPATSESQKWGMVFEGATIKRPEGKNDQVTDGSYNLGRPWHGEPRTYYLNTIMEVLPSDNGWAGMSNIVTHFYEYNSMDANGKPIDLSKRGNASSSTNQYTPVLTDEEVLEFTVNNVVGGEDGWMPAKLTQQLPAPEEVKITGSIMEWKAVENALCYIICKDGEYVAATTETTYDLGNIDKESKYTVQTANVMGGIDAASEAYLDSSSGIKAVLGSPLTNQGPAYNTVGIRVPDTYKGIIIKNGEKYIVK